jgi:hypothetical protein
LRDVARDRDLLVVATDSDPNREQKIRDYDLCLRLLAGTGREGFPKAGSEEERAARAALARYLRSRLSGNIAELLALAIDPRTKSPNKFFKRPTRIVRFAASDQRSYAIFRSWTLSESNGANLAKRMQRSEQPNKNLV